MNPIHRNIQLFKIDAFFGGLSDAFISVINEALILFESSLHTEQVKKSYSLFSIFLFA